MRMKSYCINVRPIAWQRPKLNGQRFYDGQNADKVSFGLYLLQQHNNEPLFNSPISLEAIFYMPIPPSKYKANEGDWHICVPDCDNYLKFLLDSIKNVLIIDDRIICSLSGKKIYSKQPRTEFIIKEL